MRVAAALALDSARLEADVQERATEVRASGRRLLTAADAERRALEQQLSDGPLAVLRRVERLLDDTRAEGAGDLRDELHDAITALTDLDRGLFPSALMRADLAGALRELTRRSPVAATFSITGDERRLSEEVRAAVCFACSEALTNVARHSAASNAAVDVRIEHDALIAEVRDDGHGGATATRGLRASPIASRHLPAPSRSGVPRAGRQRSGWSFRCRGDNGFKPTPGFEPGILHAFRCDAPKRAPIVVVAGEGRPSPA